jgi:hypothetical protein
MPNQKTQFVAIIGGFRDLEDHVLVRAKEKASQIGDALAKAGFGLVVYHSDKRSLEPYVVSGYAAAIVPGSERDLIRVRFAESQTGEVRFAEQENRAELFQKPQLFGDDWEAPFYRSLVEAEGVDAVLLMAGGRSTLIAGQIAVARPLPILVIDEFGGSAAKIRKELASKSSDYPSSHTYDPKELVARLKNECSSRDARRTEALRRDMVYARVSSQSRKTVWGAVAFVLLLSCILFGIGGNPSPMTYPFVMFGGLIAAGASGALVRAAFWGGEEIAPGTSFFFGGFAGFVVGLAYLIPQWIGAHGVLEPSATDVQATDKIQLISAVLVAVSAGVGFDTVVTRLKEQAEESPILGAAKSALRNTRTEG